MPTLKEMGAEVAAYQTEKGWDRPRSLAVSMALLHEEVAEAGHAWREWGLEDRTLGVSPERPQGHWHAKPEGVGSEFADILIRLLDTDNRHDMLLAEYLEDDPEVFDLDDEFMVNVNTLHGLLAHVTWAFETSGASPRAEFAAVLSFLHQLARECGINLVAEYQRKMAFNHTRERRHGGRRV
jgi:NTP pyrophosphatase (non-canonical NTP hydrolase)